MFDEESREVMREISERAAIAWAKKREAENKWRRNNTHKAQAYQRKLKYGITVEEWDALFASQGNACAVCKTQSPGGRFGQWQTDHCHKTNLVRGILCHHCNLILGHAKDTPEILRAAIAYLER